MRARPDNGFTLIELIATTALMATLGIVMVQFIVVFYRFRLVDGITSMMFSQTERIQQDFQWYCQNASSIRMYGAQTNRQFGSTNNVQATGNYFEATVSSATPPIRGIEYSPSQNALLIYSYASDGTLSPGTPNPVVLCRNSVQYQIRSGVPDSAVFNFRNHVPYLEFTLKLPHGIPQGGVSTGTVGEYFDVTIYSKPSYMQ
ncbi:MAG TPA: prepilin-type N-terminal cleavage/methylation domain-containing protein [Chthoniobacterales bacterium]